MSVRAALIISFIATCGIPLLIFWLWPHSAALEAKVKDAEQRHLVIAEGAGETLSVYHKSVVLAFDALVEPMQSGADISFSQELLSSLGFRHLCVVDRHTGDVLSFYTTQERELPRRLPPVVLAEVERILASGDKPMSHIFVDPKGVPQFLLARSIGDRIVVASVDSDTIRKVSNGISFDEHGHSAILDAGGRIIAHPNSDWVAQVKDLSTLDPIREVLDDEESGILIFHSPALDEDVIAGVAHVADANWTVLVPQPMSELQQQISFFRNSASVVFSIGLVLSAAVGIFASYLITRPLKEVAAAADRLVLGRTGTKLFPSRLPILREIRSLWVSFELMTHRMEAALGRMAALAEEDPLTGLLNRRTFQQHAQSRLDTAPSDTKQFALFLLDLDNLKSINDLYGHGAGDEAIVALSLALRRIFPGEAILCRSGGDEFLVLVAIEDSSKARHFAAEVQNALRSSPCKSIEASHLSCSIGATTFQPRDGALSSFIAEADQAMYVAKRRGGSIQIFDAVIKSETRRRAMLSTQLRTDVKLDRLEAAFQPIFDVRTNAVVSFEALARWRTGEADVIPPAEFIEIAKEQGFLVQLDRTVRRRAMCFARAMRDVGSEVPVSVNITAHDLARSDFVERILSETSTHGLEHDDIVLEVTEAVFDDRLGFAASSLSRLRDAGVRVDLDDFGKGFSSHGLLKSHSFKTVKIDLGFAGDIHASDEARAIISSLIELGDRLGLRVVLEGIETEADKSFALSQKISSVQGFYFARPMGHDDAVSFVRAQDRRSANEKRHVL